MTDETDKLDSGCCPRCGCSSWRVRLPDFDQPGMETCEQCGHIGRVIDMAVPVTVVNLGRIELE